jgi:hypothetical protein
MKPRLATLQPRRSFHGVLMGSQKFNIPVHPWLIRANQKMDQGLREIRARSHVRMSLDIMKGPCCTGNSCWTQKYVLLFSAQGGAGGGSQNGPGAVCIPPPDPTSWYEEFLGSGYSGVVYEGALRGRPAAIKLYRRAEEFEGDKRDLERELRAYEHLSEFLWNARSHHDNSPVFLQPVSAFFASFSQLSPPCSS